MFFGQDILMKVGMFVLVQALVYLILSQSSTIFSNSDPAKRSHNFKPSRSLTIRSFMVALADLPAGSELSPTVPRGSSTPTKRAATPK
ncbi:hypothetical protein TIFTF001_033213 [Ficus carica]|uniref:Uncharacterized protein n=1 Tax=Ficus carica TaxID=3494 RepID=A0AA88J6U8_FICCA|nr:hypothetical protein TIFTF001_033213 [Ficus carica]